jgi:hypothetical protein
VSDERCGVATRTHTQERRSPYFILCTCSSASRRGTKRRPAWRAGGLDAASARAGFALISERREMRQGRIDYEKRKRVRHVAAHKWRTHHDHRCEDHSE